MLFNDAFNYNITQHQQQLNEQSGNFAGMTVTRKYKVPGKKNLSQCHCVHQKSHMDWSRFNPSLCSDTSEQLTAWTMTQHMWVTLMCNYRVHEIWDMRFSQQWSWGFRPSVMWHSLIGFVVPDLSKDQVDLILTCQAVLEDEGITIPWNVRSYTTPKVAQPIQLVLLTKGQFMHY